MGIRLEPLKRGGKGYFMNSRIEGMTPNQKRFADRYIELIQQPGDKRRCATRAYRETLVLDRGIDALTHQGARMLRMPEVKFYIERQITKLKGHLYHLATEAKSEQVQLGATMNALDRVFGKPVQSTEVTGADGGPISVQSLGLIYERALKLNGGGEAGTKLRGAVGDDNPHGVA